MESLRIFPGKERIFATVVRDFTECGASLATLQE